MSEQQVDSEVVRTQVLAEELRTVLGQLTRRLREEGTTGEYTQSQKSVLVRLERGGPATLAALARAEGMRPQSMRTILAVLIADGLVSGEPDPSDRRQTILSLTQAAHEKIASDRAARQDWLFRSIREKLTSAEQQQLAASTELLRRLLIP